MDDDSESNFDTEHVKEVILKHINGTLGVPGQGQDTPWQDHKQTIWIQTIIEMILKDLALMNEALSKQDGAPVFKFVGTARRLPAA